MHTCRTEIPTADQDTEPVFVSVRAILTLPDIVPVKLAVRVAFMIQVICMQERKAGKNGSTVHQLHPRAQTVCVA